MTPKITIHNRTLWPTRMLRPFITRIAREEFPGTKPSNTRGHLTIDIVYNRAGKDLNYCTGRATVGGSWSVVRVPYPHPGKTFPVLDFCHVVGHEFGHNKGLRHAEMGLHYGNSCRRGSYTDPHYAWAEALPVPVVPVTRKPTTAERRATRLATARAAVARWARKRKLAETKLKLWTRKVRALERVLAAPELAAACTTPDRKVDP